MNRIELQNKYGKAKYYELLQLILDDSDLLTQFRGCFTGFVFNKITQAGFAFTNQTGDVSVFYHYDFENKKLIVSNNFNELHRHVDKQYLTLDEQAAHYLLTFGYTIDDSTICQGIKRLQAGKILRLNGVSFEVERYHRFSFKPTNTLSSDATLERLHQLFQQAVKRCLDKDLECGCSNHLIDLSAGLDSRVVNWVAKELGYKNIVNISYSQSGTDEEHYTQNIANALSNQYFHHSLDDAGFLFEIDRMVEESFGLGYYNAITGGFRCLNLINFENFGCELTGWLGGESFGGLHFGTGPNINYNTGRNSSLLKLRLGKVDKFEDQEEYNLYTRQAQGILNTAYLRDHYTYALSPFMDVDFLEYCYSIPYEQRDKHKIYWAWVKMYYTSALSFPCSTRSLTTILGFTYRAVNKLISIRASVCRKFGIQRFSYIDNHMKPYDKWYYANDKVREFVTAYYNNHIELLSGNDSLRRDCEQLYSSTKTTDKFLAISLLGTIKRYCSH